MKIRTVRVERDTALDGHGILPAGEYRCEMPDDYDAGEVRAEDIVYDCQIRIVDVEEEA